MSQLPAVGGYTVGGLVVIAGVIRFLFGDNKAFQVLKDEIQMLREGQQENASKLAAVEALYNENRTDKHMYINKYARSQVLLGVVKRLADQCTCGALDNVAELIDRALADAD